MVQGQRNRQKRSQKDTNAQQGNITRNEESLAEQKKEKVASDTDRRISEQAENERLAEKNQANSSAQEIGSESSQPKQKGCFSRFCQGVTFVFDILRYVFIYLIICVARLKHHYFPKPPPEVEHKFKKNSNKGNKRK